MDPEENKRNSETPSTVSMEHQLVYKIASLEATISNSLRRLDEKFDRMQTELHDRHIEQNAQLTALHASVDNRFALKRTRIDSIEKELTKVKTELEDEIERAIEKTAAYSQNERNAICTRLDTLEKWQNAMATRVSVGIGAVVIAWAVFGDSVQLFIQRAFGGQ